MLGSKSPYNVFDKEIIYVTNLGCGSTLSRNSVHVIEAGVLPKECIERGWIGPDVVTWSHGMNDVLSRYGFMADEDIAKDEKDEVGDQAQKKQLQDFHNAVKRMRCDNNDMTLVACINDYYSQYSP